jgi:hypothetical protein
MRYTDLKHQDGEVLIDVARIANKTWSRGTLYADCFRFVSDYVVLVNSKLRRRIPQRQASGRRDASKLASQTDSPKCPFRLVGF